MTLKKLKLKRKTVKPEQIAVPQTADFVSTKRLTSPRRLNAAELDAMRQSSNGSALSNISTRPSRLIKSSLPYYRSNSMGLPAKSFILPSKESVVPPVTISGEPKKSNETKTTGSPQQTVKKQLVFVWITNKYCLNQFKACSAKYFYSYNVPSSTN